MSEAAKDTFEHCSGCPSKPGCSAAMYCVTESRFHDANRVIASPVCKTCKRSADSGAWACVQSADPAMCDAQSDLWGQWFLVQMYAQDEKRRLETGRPPGADAGEESDDDYAEPCSHEHDEDCYDYQGFYVCTHSHCFNCGGCGCPGYCDDFATYNLRPGETGGAPEYPAGEEMPGGE